MEKQRLGILGTSDIAAKRFLPALQKSRRFTYVGVASRQLEKTESFVRQFGGKGYEGYRELILSPDVDVLYIPLPPALHFEWAKMAMENGKHVLVEKPSTTCFEETKELVGLASKNHLAFDENYMFQYHSQLAFVRKMLREKELGELRLCRIAFGFPMRLGGDFRYNRELGGGALLDCGGYPVRLAAILLGDTVKLSSSRLNVSEKFEVDLYGSATLENAEGLTAQISFGMDNSYKCELELWGSKGYARFPRIFTAPVGVRPQAQICVRDRDERIELPEDDQFLNAIEHFGEEIEKDSIREESFQGLLTQSTLIDQIRNSQGDVEK